MAMSASLMPATKLWRGYVFASLWRTISSTTRASGAVASMTMPFFGVSSSFDAIAE
jgi:hypothetical protein